MKTDANDKVNLKFLGVDFVNVNFEYLNNIQEDIKFDMKIKIQINSKSPQYFQVQQGVMLHINNGFYLSTNAIGKFELSKDIYDDNIKKNLITLNAPAIMFPYIRSFISTLTANLGDNMIKITIPPQFFSNNIPIEYYDND